MTGPGRPRIGPKRPVVFRDGQLDALKAISANQAKTVSELVREGADLVIARYPLD